jgi:Lipase (class 3)
MPVKSGVAGSLFLLCFLNLRAQSLEPGFSGKEYLDILSISAERYDSAASTSAIPLPVHYNRVYLSPEIGLKNRWSMWYRDDNKLAVLSIRGTIPDKISWLANFYAAMVPASGTLQLNDSIRFDYRLSADPKAAVHVGWLVGLAAMSTGMLLEIRKAYAAGIHEFIISGHSQGGALSFLTTSYLRYLKENGDLPSDIVFKTYCSAAPKPGNLYYAYDYDFITRNGWSFTVVNAADWVPESLLSVQLFSDFNPVNPFVNVHKILKKQKFLVRTVLTGKYNKADRKTRKAQRYFEKELGHTVFTLVHKSYPQLKEPQYVHSNNYQRAGSPIVLQPDSAYYIKHPNDPTNIFAHHLLEPYYELTVKYYGKQ